MIGFCEYFVLENFLVEGLGIVCGIVIGFLFFLLFCSILILLIKCEFLFIIFYYSCLNLKV